MELSSHGAGSAGKKTMTKKIAALFIQTDGCYADIDFIDAWPEERDELIKLAINAKKPRSG